MMKIKNIKNIKSSFLKYRNLSTFASQNFNVDSWSENNGVKMDKNRNILLNTLTFPDQKIFCGLDSLKATFNALLERTNGSSKNSLIVTDKGIFERTEAIKITRETLDSKMSKVAVFSETKENPSVYDVLNITKKYLENDCDNIIAVGGGGPMDAAKASAAMIGRIKMGNFYDLGSEEALMWPVKDLKQLLSTGKFPKEASQNIPPLICIPTTAGTGSESGKSSVIADKSGVKYVLGHPSFMPMYVALAPQLTYSMPPSLTSSTAVDAMFHSLEAYLVTDKDGYEDGCDDETIQNCDHFALEGIKLILKHLPLTLASPTSSQSRLALLIAASLGAKAFRKGALGSVHSTAHALGFACHIHHGTAIARMSVPVTHYNEHLLNTLKNENKLSQENQASLKKLSNLYNLFKSAGFVSSDSVHSLSDSMNQFLGSVNLKVGIKDLVGNEKPENFIEKLTEIASKDACQTNLIHLDRNDYKKVFQNAFNNYL